MTVLTMTCPHLGRMCQVPQTPRQWPSPWGRWCSRSETPGPRWRPWVGRWWWWRRRNRPSRSGSPWEERRRTGPSRRRWGSAWRSRNRMATVLPLCHLRPHLLGQSGGERWGGERRRGRRGCERWDRLKSNGMTGGSRAAGRRRRRRKRWQNIWAKMKREGWRRGSKY